MGSMAPKEMCLWKILWKERPFLKYAANKSIEEKELLATHGARTVLKMVLHHNFVHGDLHPGNVLVEESTGRLAILDVICVEIPTETHKTMVRVLRAMLEYRGDDAARLLLENNGGSDDSQDQLQREEAFVDGFAKFVEVLVRNPSLIRWRRTWATSARWR